MLPSTNYKWICACGNEKYGHKNESAGILLFGSETCEKCGSKMSGSYIKKGGPQREHPNLRR